MTMIHLLRGCGVVLVLGMGMLAPPAAYAHCDTLDGPVVTDAKTALAHGDVTPVLKWIRAEDTAAITAAFTRTLTVRTLSPDAKVLADTYFFETLVRIHRAGEGAPYTGLQPAGMVEPAIAAADAAIVQGKADALVMEVTALVAQGIRERFARVVETRKHVNDSVDAGRAYVAAYVEYIHYIEGLHQAAAGATPHGAEDAHNATAHPDHAEADVSEAHR